MHRTMNKKNSICTHLSHECVVYMPLLHYTTQVDTKTTPSHVHPQCTCWQEPRYVQHDGGIHCIYMFWDVLHVNHSRWEGMLLFLNNVITLMRSAWCQFVAFKSSLGLGLRSLLLNVWQSAFSTWTHICTDTYLPVEGGRPSTLLNTCDLCGKRRHACNTNIISRHPTSSNCACIWIMCFFYPKWFLHVA